jgi:hypothetical protein
LALCKFDEELAEFLLKNPSYYPIMHKISTSFKSEWTADEMGIQPKQLRTLIKINRVRELGAKRGCKKLYVESPHMGANLRGLDEYIERVGEIRNDNDSICEGTISKGGGIDLNKIKEELDLKIIGHDSIKKIVMKVLKSPKPVHILLEGPPASGKSLIGEILQKYVDTCEFVIGSQTSKAGLFELLSTKRPAIIIIDEIDKITNSDDLSVLLSLMASGYIRRVKGDSISDIIHLDTRVMAMCNRISKSMKAELLSRFLKFKLKEYSKDEFIEVCKNCILLDIESDEEIADHIAREVWNIDQDIRTAVAIARLGSDSIDEVKENIEIYKEYQE